MTKITCPSCGGEAWLEDRPGYIKGNHERTLVPECAVRLYETEYVENGDQLGVYETWICCGCQAEL